MALFYLVTSAHIVTCWYDPLCSCLGRRFGCACSVEMTLSTMYLVKATVIGCEKKNAEIPRPMRNMLHTSKWKKVYCRDTQDALKIKY